MVKNSNFGENPMCVKTEDHRFVRAVKVQIGLEKSYRILIGKRSDASTNEFYGICLENGLEAKSKKLKPFALRQILDNIIYQSKKADEFNNITFGSTPIICVGAINGKISEQTDTYLKNREKNRRVRDKIFESWLKPSLAQMYEQEKVIELLHLKVCQTSCREYNSCKQRA